MLSLWQYRFWYINYIHTRLAWFGSWGIFEKQTTDWKRYKTMATCLNVGRENFQLLENVRQITFCCLRRILQSSAHELLCSYMMVVSISHHQLVGKRNRKICECEQLHFESDCITIGDHRENSKTDWRFNQLWFGRITKVACPYQVLAVIYTKRKKERLDYFRFIKGFVDRFWKH